MKINLCPKHQPGLRFARQKVKSNCLIAKSTRKWAALLISLAVLPLAAPGQADYATPYTFTTLAGNTGHGSADGTGPAARFASPNSVAADSAGNVYVADTINDTIRKVTPAGVVTTLAGLAGCSGSADGTNSAALFDEPDGLALDTNGNLYVSDLGNHTIRKITPVGTNWVVTTLAGQPGVSGSADGTNSAARFYTPLAEAVDSAGNLYVADAYNDIIRKVTPVGTNWMVTTLAGQAGVAGSANGTGTNAQFDQPFGLAVDGAGNVYVADSYNFTIRMVTPAGVVTTIAGLAGTSGTNDGPGSAARFYGPWDVAVDNATNLYVSDLGNFTIRKMTPLGGSWMVTTIAGLAGTSGTNNGTGSAARFDQAFSVAVNSSTNLYVADTGNNMIRHVIPVGSIWEVTTLAGLMTGGAGSADGTGTNAQFNKPIGVAVDGAGNVYVGEYNNNTIRQVTPAGVVTTIAGLPGHPGSNNGTGSAARFNGLHCLAVDSATNVYVADSGNHTIRKITPVGTNWVVTTLAGKADDPGLADGSPGQFDYPTGVAVDTNGNVYVGDSDNAAVRKVTPAGVVTTVSTDFSGPLGVAVGPDGNLYVADYYSYSIRKLTLAGVMTIVAGNGSPGSADGTGMNAQFNYPSGIAVDSATNLYIGDYGNDTIRKVTPVGTTWVVTTLAGEPGIGGFADGTGRVPRFKDNNDVALDSAGNLYVADLDNNTIRKGCLASAVPAPNLQAPSLGAGQFGFGVTGLPNLAVGIESSDNLSQWQVIGILTLEGGTNSFDISPNPSLDAQFFRIHVR